MFFCGLCFFCGYQPQQSVLKRQVGQRQTACIRNIWAPQRSQITVSSPVRHALAAISVVRIGFGTKVSFPGSGMGRIIANVYALKTSVA